MKTIWHILGGILAFFLCLILILSLFLVPIISYVTESMDPENLAELIVSSGLFDKAPPEAANREPLLANGSVFSSNSYSSLFKGIDLGPLEDALKDLADSDLIDIDILLEQSGLPKDIALDAEKLVEKLTESDALQKLLVTYVSDIMDAALGVGNQPALKTDTVMDLLRPHIAEVVEIVTDCLPKNTEVDTKKLTSAVDSAMNHVLPSLVEKLPPAEELAETVIGSDNEEVAQVLAALKIVRTGQLRLIAISLSLGLAVLIVLFLLPGIRGLRWVGISGLFGAVLCAVPAFVLKVPELASRLQKAADSAAGLMMDILSGLSSTFVSFAVIYGIAGVVLIVATTVLHSVFSRK